MIRSRSPKMGGLYGVLFRPEFSDLHAEMLTGRYGLTDAGGRRRVDVESCLPGIRMLVTTHHSPDSPGTDELDMT